MVLEQPLADNRHGADHCGRGRLVGVAPLAHGHADGRSLGFPRFNATHGGQPNSRVGHRCIAKADVLHVQVQRSVQADSRRQL